VEYVSDYEMRDIKKRLMEWGILKGEEINEQI